MKKHILFLILTLFSISAYCQNQEVDLSGEWSVQIKQDSDREPVEYAMKVSIKQLGTMVMGEFHFDLGEIPIQFEKQLKGKKEFKTPFRGEIVKGHLRITYDNTSPGIDQFGSAMIKVVSNRKMEGYFLGFGPETQEIVQGELNFSR